MMLSAIIALIVEVFLPKSYQKYLFMNYKQSSQYRTYNSIVPDYLHDRPKTLISYCLERRSKALKCTIEDVSLVDDRKGFFSVKGTSGKNHNVNFALHHVLVMTGSLGTYHASTSLQYFIIIPSGTGIDYQVLT